MDIVIPVKPGRSNEELRYALRTFEAHLPHDRVWIIGAKPHWVRNVNWVQTKQVGLKYQNTTLAIKTACLNKDISEEFIYCNDDFFVMYPTPVLEAYHRGFVIDQEKYYTKKYKNVSSKYVQGMIETRKLLQSLGHTNPISYELHIPMVINKEKMLKVLDIGKNLTVFHKRTAYGNLTGMSGTRMRDPKILNRAIKDAKGKQFLSTTLDSFRYGAVGKYIRDSFRSPSIYEPPVRRTR